MIIIESKHKKLDNLRKEYPNAIVADVTSKSDNSLQKLSPFYPWGGIPVPYSPGVFASCVEAVWQGLKVFQNQDIDIDMFNKSSMCSLKRTTKKYGKILRHRRGIYGHVLFDYLEARKRIFIPTYRWMLENKAYYIIKKIREVYTSKLIILLDYDINCDIENLNKPFSHAFLIKAYVEGLAPYEDVIIKNTTYHHGYYGRREISWTVEECSYKEIPPKESKNTQQTIDFDF